MSHTVSDVLVKKLVSWGVRRIYGLVGDSLNPVMEALQGEERLRWIHVRHEETAAFAASAEAQLTGCPAVCCGSCGPGNMHLINGLYDAHRSGAPVFALASHIPTSAIGSAYFQETHPTHFFSECTRYLELVSQPEQVRPVVSAALRHAVAERGVGMAVLPGDVAALPLEMSKEEGEEAEGGAPTPELAPPGEPAPAAVAALAEKLNAARSVAFLCGIGCTGAQKELVELAQKLGAPVAYTLRAKDVMEQDNPCAVGMTGLLGWGDATHALHEAELLVLWGTDFPYASFLPTHGRVVQVDRDGAALGRRTRLCLGIQADVGCTVRQVLPLVSVARGDEFLSRSLTRHGRKISKLQAYVREVDEEKPIRPEYVTRLVSDHAEPDAVFTIDTGTPVIWAARYLQAFGSRRLLGSFRHGSMACALAMAIGAKAAFPSRQVIALCGDGGLSMLPGDLLTLVQEGLGVKVFVYNNSALDFVAMEQQIVGMRPMGTNLLPTRYDRMAQAMGLESWRIEKPTDAPAAVKRWLAAPGPALLDVVVDSHALALPPDLSLLQALGFTKSLGRSLVHNELDLVKRVLFGNRKLL